MSEELANQNPPESEASPPHAMFRDLGEGDATAIGKPKKMKIATTQITVALVLAIGGGAIYWMRETGMRSGMKFDNEPVAFQSQYTPDDHRRFQRVLRDLEQSNSRVQIAAVDAGDNPFFIGIVKEDRDAMQAEAEAERERIREAEMAQREAEMHQQEIEQALDNLRLGTILYSSNPKVSIDNRVVGIGEIVGEIFTVTEIMPSAVIVEIDGVPHTITPQSHGPGARR